MLLTQLKLIEFVIRFISSHPMRDAIFAHNRRFRQELIYILASHEGCYALFLLRDDPRKIYILASHEGCYMKQYIRFGFIPIYILASHEGCYTESVFMTHPGRIYILASHEGCYLS